MLSLAEEQHHTSTSAHNFDDRYKHHAARLRSDSYSIVLPSEARVSITKRDEEAENEDH